MPRFNWSELEQLHGSRFRTKEQARAQYHGGFTVEELAARYGISTMAANERVRVMKRNGTVREALRTSYVTGPDERGARDSIRMTIFDVARGGTGG